MNDKSKKIALKIILGIVAAVMIVYLGMSVYFMNHFCFNTTVNGMDISWKSSASVGTALEKQAKEYILVIKGREGLQDEIAGTAIELQHENVIDLEATLEKQNAFLWFMAFFENGKTEVNLLVSYDEEKLSQEIDGLEVLKDEFQAAPVSAKPVYDGTHFEIEPESLGNTINKEVLVKAITDAVCNLKTELDMDVAGCYVAPTYVSDSKEVLEAAKTANAYLQSQITYTIDDDRIVINAEDVSEWITISKKMKVSFSEKKIKEYLEKLDEKYNTVGDVRKITTPTGKKASVSGGTYGREIDVNDEYKQLLEDIKAQETVVREPIYTQKIDTSGGPIWGTTYVEVDITEQHMWYIKDGEVIFESDVVTGTPNADRRTPQGVYTILEKMRDKVLKGRPLPNGKPSYLTPVSYWMRVTWTGIGFHDATWQAKFGGKRYKQGHGSHGCINMPLKKAAELYELLEKGCPVIIHY